MPEIDFETLAAAHLESAYNLARMLVHDPALADDVVQDAMLRALTYFTGFRGGNARAWVLQIVRNVALTRLKGNTRSKVVPLDATHGVDAEREGEAEALSIPTDARHEPEATLMREDDERLVQRLLAGLPVKLRECVVLREIEELSYKEIARIVDAPIGTVMSRLWRGRKLLADAAGNLEPT
ncbi:MAG: sigma-70 family RNA polymerase sigma factor [Gammaproteobacteria bacterium]